MVTIIITPNHYGYCWFFHDDESTKIKNKSVEFHEGIFRYYYYLPTHRIVFRNQIFSSKTVELYTKYNKTFFEGPIEDIVKIFFS